jgi:hypothetical protein
LYAPDVPEIPSYGDAHHLPEWYGPPQMLGGYVTGPLLISRSDRVVVAVRQVIAFPAGVEAEVEAHARGPRAAGPSRGPLHPPEHSLRFRVQFPDGRQAAQDDEAGLRTGAGRRWWSAVPRAARAARTTVKTSA